MSETDTARSGSRNRLYSLVERERARAGEGLWKLLYYQPHSTQIQNSERGPESWSGVRKLEAFISFAVGRFGLVVVQSVRFAKQIFDQLPSRPYIYALNLVCPIVSIVAYMEHRWITIVDKFQRGAGHMFANTSNFIKKFAL
jgi:hypothetical protein